MAKIALVAVTKKGETLKTMKGQTGGGFYQWITVHCLSGLSTRIMVRFIQTIEITADEIKICVDNKWTFIRRYNQETIETQLRETQKDWEDIHSMNDLYFGKGTEARQVKEDQENERCYLESLGGTTHAGGVSWEVICEKALSTEISWLRDADFDQLKKKLESLSDVFAVDVEEKNHG